MADASRIEWTDATWNPIVGCSVVSPGCTNCYAMKLAGTRMKHHPSRQGLTAETKAGPVWNGQVRLVKEWLTQPLQWKRPRRIFVCAHGDLFHESVPDAWIDQVLAIMALAPQHTFQVLTKRAGRMRAYFAMLDSLAVRRREFLAIYREVGGSSELWLPNYPLPNVWLGVSAEDQARADERIPDLLATPAAVRFVSAEPLLGPINLERVLRWHNEPNFSGEFLDVLRGHVVNEPKPGFRGCRLELQPRTKIDWIIVGGESGPGARPMHPGWARSLRDQCASAGVPFFFKQWGEWAPGTWSDNGDDVDWQSHDPKLMTWPDKGQHAYWRDRVHWFDEEQAPDGPGAIRVGKHIAGRRLDGRTHDAMPGDTE